MMIGDWDWNLLSKMMVKTMSYNLRFSFDLSFRWKIFWESHNNHCEWHHSVSTKCRNTGVGSGFFKMPKVQGQKRGPILVVRLHPWSHSVLNNVAGELLTDTLSSHFCRTYYPLDIISEPHIAKRSFIGLPFYSGLCYELKMQWY